jgi:hypothetical protein
VDATAAEVGAVKRLTAAQWCCLILMLAAEVGAYRSLYGSLGFVLPLTSAGVAGLLTASLASARNTVGRVHKVVIAFTGLALTAAAWFAFRPDPVAAPAAKIARSVTRLLTLNRPVDVANDVLLFPFAITALAAFLAGLALRSRSLLLPLVPPATALVVQLALCAGSGDAPTAAAGVVLFAVSAVLLVGLRRITLDPEGTHDVRGEVAPLAGFALLAALAVAGGAVAAGGPQQDRYDPRTRWAAETPAALVTPLSLLRSELSGEPLDRFTVRLSGPGRDAVTRFSIATLDRFDGTTWSATPDFRTAGTVLRPVGEPGEPGDAVRSVIRVIALPSSLQPVPGSPRTVRPAAGDVLFDRAGGMLRVVGDTAGREFTIDGVTGSAAEGPAEPTAADCLPDSGVAVPASVRSWVPGKRPDQADLEALATRMHALPYDPEAPAGGSLAAIARVLAGDSAANSGSAEQHAAAFSYLACAAQLPARVVVGYRLPATGDLVTSHDAHAWSEVFLRGRGWVAFDPTDPNKTRTPFADLAAVTEQPPPTAQPSSGVKPTDADPPVDPVQDVGPRTPPSTRFVVLLIVVALALTLVAPVVRWLRVKIARHRERKAHAKALLRARTSGTPGQRILAAWESTTRMLREDGVPVRPSSSPGDVSALVAHHAPALTGPVEDLAELVNAALFAPEPLPITAGDHAWVISDGIYAYRTAIPEDARSR